MVLFWSAFWKVTEVVEQFQNLAAFLGIAGVAIASGHLLLTATGLISGRFLLDLAFAGGSGALLLAMLTGVLAVLHLLWLPAWLVLLFLGGLLYCWSVKAAPALPFLSRCEGRASGDSEMTGAFESFEKGAVLLMSGLVVGHLLLNFAAALAPPTGVDSLIYHLAIPKIYLAQGGMEYLPSMYPSTSPFLLQMLYLFAQWLHGPEVAQLLNSWALVLSCLVVYELAGGRKQAAPALFAVLLYLSISDVVYQASIALIDVTAALFLLLSFASMTIWFRRRQARWLIMAGIMAGAFATGRISNAGLVIAMAVGLVAVVLAEGKRTRETLVTSLAHAAIFASLAFLVVLPWYLRSWWYTGNPFYPYLYNIFGGANLSAEVAAYVSQLSFYKTVGARSLSGFLMMPWEITMNPERFRSGVIGPVMLSCLPLVFIYRRQMPAWIRYFAVFIGIALPVWYLTYIRVRSFLPVLALLAVFTALAIGKLLRDQSPSRWLKGAIVGVCSLWIATGLATNLYHHTSAVLVAVGMRDRDDYLREELSATGFEWFEDFQVLNRELPPYARVLIWEDRGFYLDVDYLWANGLWRGLASHDELRSPDKLMRRLQLLGVTHLAWNRGAAASKQLEMLRQSILKSKTPTPVVLQSPRIEVREILYSGCYRQREPQIF